MRDERLESPDLGRGGEVEPPPGFFARAGAFLIDWAIVLLLSMFIAVGTVDSIEARTPIALVVLSVYEIGFLVATSATPGKMAMRMHVADPAGGRLEPDKLILRYLIFFIGTILVVGIPVNVVLILTDPQRRALHDRIAGTRVLVGRPAWIRDET
jgi:uncharacterized RDD family membrane protein YckC